MKKIPITLVTGFLGSGKTTFLRRYAESHPEHHLIFLVNEFAETSIDGPTLESFGTPTQSIVGGSLFCECKSADFVKVMRETVLVENERTPLDGVVIETSGIADPQAIGTLLSNHGLDEVFTIVRIVTIVAPARFKTLVENMDVVRAQIETSDVVIINKTDLASAEKIEYAERTIRALNPNTLVRRATHCRTDSDFGPRRASTPGGQLSTCDANPFSTATLPIPFGIGRDAFETWLAGLPPQVLRIKGMIQTIDGWIRVDKTVDNQTIEPCPKQPASNLIAIVHDNDAGVLQTIRDSLAAACTTDAVS